MDEIVYVCNECGETFSLEEGRTQHYEEGDITVCPECGSDDIEEGERCKICRQIVYKHQIRHGVCYIKKDKKLLPCCFADAISSYKSCINYLMPWEREVLEDEYGTIDITEREE